MFVKSIWQTVDFTLIVKVDDFSKSQATPVFDFQFYLSKDTSFSSDDASLRFSGVDQASKLTSVTAGLSIDLSSSAEQLVVPQEVDGLYCGITNILAVADSSQIISEVTESNNALAKEIFIDCKNGECFTHYMIFAEYFRL